MSERDADRRPADLLVVCGPTGTGKSALGLALAERLGGEIVGCDSLQVYRGFDVGTAKPSTADRRRVPHHLIDHADPEGDYSLARYVRDAQAVIESIDARRRTPIVVGGTGLYLRGLLLGLVEAPDRHPVLRERLRSIARRRGHARLHRWLSRLDPASAERIGPADTQRVVRALEVALLSESTWSERLAAQGGWHDVAPRYTTLKIGLDLPRDELGARLDARVERFFRDGWVDEVRRLVRRVPASANAFQAIGYREILAALAGGLEPAGTIDEIRRRTRRYAKRQRTWFRREPGVVWLDARQPLGRLVEAVMGRWSGRPS